MGDDDRKYGLEQKIEFIYDKLPYNSPQQIGATIEVLKLLWYDLPHPPYKNSRALDDDEEEEQQSSAPRTFGSTKYREADGSNNNPEYPNVGRAGERYLVSVPAKTDKKWPPVPAEELFDSLMLRPAGEFSEHPNQISSMLFYLATLIIHDIFYTSHVDPWISQTSSYLDLAPLYGNNQEQQDSVRTFKDGMLKPDVFAQKRLLGQLDGVRLLLIMFNRFHNHIAAGLAEQNEASRFNKPSDGNQDALAKYDNDLFQTARLITCGLYINIILKDYVRTILRLNQTNNKWSLDPRMPTDTIPKATGNQVAAEFNLVYRWHSTLSKRDTKRTEQIFEEVLGKDYENLPLPEILQKLSEWEKKIPAEPEKRQYFPNVNRGEDGKLPDEPLLKLLVSCVKDTAGAYGAFKVPKVLRPVEILGIGQYRRWALATLNEVRKKFHLKEYETFEEINPDPKVQEALRRLYGSPEKVEVYPGLVIEAAKEPREASGLCPPFTTSRTVLSDAVSLVRGDRFYTTDYTKENLTEWGYAQADYDNEIDEGHVFYKLIHTAFPGALPGQSIFAHYPLVTPSKNQEVFEKLGKKDKYNFDEPAAAADGGRCTTM